MKTAAGLAFWLVCFALSGDALAQFNGTYRFCRDWQYAFSDANLGEDHLWVDVDAGYQWYQYIPAAGTYYTVDDGVNTLQQGWLDSQGCADLSAQPGVYNFWFTHSIQHPGTPNLSAFRITRTTTSGYTWHLHSYNLPGLASGTQSYWASSGLNNLARVAAVVTRLRQVVDSGINVTREHFIASRAGLSRISACLMLQSPSCGYRPHRVPARRPVVDVLQKHHRS